MDARLALFQLCFNLGADAVGKLTHDRTLLSGKLAHLLEDGGHFTFFAQQPDTKLFQRGRGGGFLQSCHGVQPDFL